MTAVNSHKVSIDNMKFRLRKEAKCVFINTQRNNNRRSFIHSTEFFSQDLMKKYPNIFSGEGLLCHLAKTNKQTKIKRKEKRINRKTF